MCVKLATYQKLDRVESLGSRPGRFIPGLERNWVTLRTNLDALGAESSLAATGHGVSSSVVQQVAYSLFHLRYHVCFQDLDSVANSVEHSPFWEAVSFSASQEIPHNLWNPKVYYHTQKNLSPIPILSHLRPVKHFLC
jgi:hypothetical protein